MIDLKLDTLSHDLIIENYDLGIVIEGEQVRQNVKQRLLHFTKEWFLDLEAGTPWIESILIKGARVANISSILKARIAETVGIAEILDFNLTDSGERALSVAFRARLNDNSTITDNVQVNI